MSAFYKPELALRRALELASIQQQDAALALLHDVLSNRRNRTWSLPLEHVMMAYLDLCIAHNKAREAKDGLHQYRNLSQSTAPGSLEKVIRHLMSHAESKCSQAKALADRMAAAEDGSAAEPSAADDDLDMDGEMSSTLWLTSMSTDPSAQRRDAVILLPALKFLWETYRAVLDILKTNSKLEHVYHATAVNALRFCREYERRNEFRRLCEMMRTHLGNLQKFGSNSHLESDENKMSYKVRGWEGWSAEAIELHLQTRFAQLETASTLHLYTEGFRTVEDIYNILQISQARRKNDPTVPPPKAKLMAAYYDKLTTLFWVSENYLFHAFASYRYYALGKEYNKSMSEQTAREQASAVLLAALCIPSSKKSNLLVGANSTSQFVTASPSESSDVLDSPEAIALLEKRAKMATLLGFQTRNPTREALLEEIHTRGILQQVPTYLRDLFSLLEESSDPLDLVSSATPLLSELEKSESKALAQYVPQLQSVILLKLLMSLSDAYHTVSMDQWKDLVSGLGMSLEQIEKRVVLFASTHSHLSVTIDHRARCLRFGSVQMESDAIRSQLTVLATQLDAVCTTITADTPYVKASAEERSSSRTAIYAALRQKADDQHVAAVQRKRFIEKRKEESERLVQEKKKAEEAQLAREEALRKAEEEQRIARELRLREQEKQRKIEQEMENQRKVQLLEAMGQKADGMSEEEITALDVQKLQKEHQDKIQKKKDEADRKTREVAKRLDYLVRAVRIEELPLIKTKYEEKIANERKQYEEITRERAKRAKKAWEADVEMKKILDELKVAQIMAGFRDKIMESRRLQHVVLCQEADQKAEEQAELDKMERARQRKRDDERRQAEEEERIRREEEERIAEQERLKKEEARRIKQQEEEERRRAEEARMAEARSRKDKETASRGRGGSSLSNMSDRSGGGGGGGRYVPPSRRNQGGGGGSSAGGSRFGDLGAGSRYAGGGRYEGRRDDRRDDRRDGGASGGNSRWRD